MSQKSKSDKTLDSKQQEKPHLGVKEGLDSSTQEKQSLHSKDGVVKADSVAKKSTPVKEVETKSKEEGTGPKKETQKKSAPQAKVQSKPAEQKFKLRDIAKRCVAGYQEHWFGSIQAFAKKQGFVDPATAAECKEILRLWGAKVSDK